MSIFAAKSQKHQPSDGPLQGCDFARCVIRSLPIVVLDSTIEVLGSLEFHFSFTPTVN